MATPVITPPASAPAAAPSAPAAPAPSSPAPAAPAAPAAPVAPAAAPSAPAAPADAPELSLEERISQGWEKAKEAVPLDDEEPAAEPSKEPVAEPAAEPAAEVLGEEPAAPPAEPAVADFDWDEGDVADPAVLATELKNDPAAAKFFEDRPALKGQIFGALRRDKENREIREYIPDLDTAKVVTQAATTFQNIDNRFLAATTPEGATEFLSHWVREAMYLDDKGQPIKDANGQYQLHPALPFILDHIGSNKLQTWGADIEKTGKFPPQFAPIVDALHKFAVTKGDERLEAAASVLKEVLAPSSSGSEEVPDALKPFADSLKAERAALDTQKKADADRQQREQQAAHLQSIERAESKAADSVKAQLKPRFESSGLTEFEQTSALREIGEAIGSALGEVNADGSWTKGSHPSSPMFQSIYDSIVRNNPPGEAREKKLEKHLMTYTQQILAPITAKVIREAKKGTLDRQAEKRTTVDSQKRASASDPRGTSIAPSSSQPQSPAQMRSQIIDEYKKAHNGEEPDMSYVMGEAFKRQNQPKR